MVQNVLHMHIAFGKGIVGSGISNAKLGALVSARTRCKVLVEGAGAGKACYMVLLFATREYSHYSHSNYRKRKYFLHNVHLKLLTIYLFKPAGNRLVQSSSGVGVMRICFLVAGILCRHISARNGKSRRHGLYTLVAPHISVVAVTSI